jgi:hypothetical protein
MRPGTASAQVGDAPPPHARAHVGPFYISPSICDSELRVDSNVYSQVKSDEPVSDFTFTVVPTFVATARPARGLVTVRSSTSLVYFAEQQSERSVDEDLGASARVTLRRVSFLGEAGYLNTRERPSLEIDARSRRIGATGAAAIGVALSPKVSAQVSGRYARTTYDASSIFDGTFLAQSLNRTTRGASGSVRYVLTPLTAFVATGEFERSRFMMTPLRDADARRILVGADMTPRALISGSFRVGFQRFRPMIRCCPNSMGSSDPRARCIGFALPPVGASFDQGVDYSYSTSALYVRWGYGVSLRRRLVERWDAEVAGSRAGTTTGTRPFFRSLIRCQRAIHRGRLTVSYQARPGTRSG